MRQWCEAVAKAIDAVLKARRLRTNHERANAAGSHCGCVGAFCFGCSYLTAFIVTRNQWRDEMIKRGVARYNWQTGWEWGEPPNESRY
jgi:hypothetical protein